MEKIFKRTLVGSLVAMAAMSTQAAEVGMNSDFKVEVYGVAAISLVNYNVTDNRDASNGTVIENESRIGFRASRDIVEGTNVFMQIESGYVDNTDWAQGGVAGGGLGFRDTFVGIKGDDWGQVRAGRMLTPMYEIVDWPFSNPGLGSVFDWGGVTGTYDRQSNQVRYDSLNYDGFTFAASVGRDAIDGRSGSATRDSYFGGVNAKYSMDNVTLLAGLETGSDFQGMENADNFAYIVGAEVTLAEGLSLAAAYKYEEVDGRLRNKLDANGDPEKDTNGDPIMLAEDVSQQSLSIIGQYWQDDIGFKLGYAANLDSKLDGAKQDDDADTISAQLMTSVNGFVPYVRVAGRKTAGSDDRDIVTRVGIEYGF